jgi:2-C-methyl-D-erythritol 4-phosphate cytidylyltransferase
MLSAIILAAGSGKRLGRAVSKPLVKIGGLPAIIYSLRALEKHAQVDEIIVVVNSKNRAAIFGLAEKFNFKKIKCFVLGGALRQDSVLCGLRNVSSQSGWVLIHDCARPFIEQSAIDRLIQGARKTGAAILAVRPKATIKIGAAANLVAKTLDRNNLWEVQTPQVFKKELLLKAYNKYSTSKVTDDASLVEKTGAKVLVVEGKYENITTTEDLLFAGLIAQRFKHAI